MKIKVRKASKKLKARRAHKKMKACIRQRYKGTQARQAPGRVEHVGTQGAWETKAREARNLTHTLSQWQCLFCV